MYNSSTSKDTLVSTPQPRYRTKYFRVFPHILTTAQDALGFSLYPNNDIIVLKIGLRVFENLLTRIFGQKRDEVTGGWRKLHNEVVCHLYSLPSTIRMIKSRRM
jgi:hypothetical protein